MPHVGIRGGKPIHERSGRELIVMFVVVPWILGIAILTMIVVSQREFGNASTWKDWLGVAWGVMLSLALMLGLPAAAWQEWQRRKQFQKFGNTSPRRKQGPMDA